MVLLVVLMVVLLVVLLVVLVAVLLVVPVFWAWVDRALPTFGVADDNY